MFVIFAVSLLVRRAVVPTGKVDIFVDMTLICWMFYIVMFVSGACDRLVHWLLGADLFFVLGLLGGERV